MNKPEWFRKVIRPKDLIDMRRLIREYGINTVCEEAPAPIGENAIKIGPSQR